MNEIQLLRHQLTLERAHVIAVANACATALGSDTGAGPMSESLGQFQRASVDYLACVLAWFEERDQRLADLIQVRFSADDLARRGFEEVLARDGRSRDALAKLETACTATGASGTAARQRSWREFREYFNGRWSTRREALEALLASNTRTGDWRILSGIDADSILEERRRYALVAAQLPAGTTLGTPMERA
jgi:hypothetical protein